MGGCRRPPLEGLGPPRRRERKAFIPGRLPRVAAEHGPQSLAEIERAHILSLLESCDWNISRTAKLLEIDRGTLYNKLDKCGVKRPAGKG